MVADLCRSRALSGVFDPWAQKQRLTHDREGQLYVFSSLR
jgi:hypothetical protein